MYAVYVGPNQWAVQRLKSVWEKLSTKWEKCYAELDQLCNPKLNSAAIAPLLRCEDEWACRRAPAQLEQEAPRGRHAALRASLPAWRLASTFSRRNAEIDRFLWHAREPLTTRNSQRSRSSCEPSSSAAAQRRRQRRRARSAQGRRATCRRRDALSRTTSPLGRASQRERHTRSFTNPTLNAPPNQKEDEENVESLRASQHSIVVWPHTVDGASEGVDADAVAGPPVCGCGAGLGCACAELGV
jgi:hypothetical protein